MEQKNHISLSELQRRIKLSVEESFPLPLWVGAEISELKVNYSGHCYLELVEKGDSDGVPRAQARATIWRSRFPQIAATFLAVTGQQLAAGTKILARVTVGYHEIYGFSLNITDIDPSYTLGDMELRRQQTIARLRDEGVWDMNRELEMPPLVQRLAVVSSANAAGYQDFCNELRAGGYAFRTTLFEAVMQGAAAEDSIVAALERVAEAADDFDAVVIIRGGGSASDLNCFNAYRLAAHVAQFPLPVLTGIGHDKDVSVTDMVAHTPLKTPTAVAAWLTDRMAQVEAAVERAALQLGDTVAAAMRRHEVLLERIAGELRRCSSEYASRRRTSLDNMRQMLTMLTDNIFARERMRLDSVGELTASRSPKRIMKLGFSVVRAGGRAVTSASDVAAGSEISVELYDGRIDATVK